MISYPPGSRRLVSIFCRNRLQHLGIAFVVMGLALLTVGAGISTATPSLPSQGTSVPANFRGKDGSAANTPDAALTPLPQATVVPTERALATNVPNESTIVPVTNNSPAPELRSASGMAPTPLPPPVILWPKYDGADDIDGDGMSNFWDFDDDGDGLADNMDPFPLIPGKYQPPPVTITSPYYDSDRDGFNNAEDPDDDNDGIEDDVDPEPFVFNETFDPTPSITSPDIDSDNDGLSNAEDPDDDNDGIPDDRDPTPLGGPDTSTEPTAVVDTPTFQEPTSAVNAPVYEVPTSAVRAPVYEVPTSAVKVPISQDAMGAGVSGSPRGGRQVVVSALPQTGIGAQAGATSRAAIGVVTMCFGLVLLMFGIVRRLTR